MECPAGRRGKDGGGIWGEEDEIGALNAIPPASVLAALALVKKGKVVDLGVMVDRNSFRWAGHAPTDVMPYRTPHGERAAGDAPPGSNDPGWHSTVVFKCDNIGTHLDGLCHFTAGCGQETHWYNGFKEGKHASDFGAFKAGADKYPPIVARGVPLDVAGYKQLDVLPPKYAVTPEDQTMAGDRTFPHAGDAILIRTGIGRFWGEAGHHHESPSRHDTEGVTLETARHLIEEFGPILIASDTSTLEVMRQGDSAHVYMLVEQGVPIGELLHYLEDAADCVYEFVYFAGTNKIKGMAAGIAIRPVALY